MILKIPFKNFMVHKFERLMNAEKQTVSEGTIVNHKYFDPNPRGDLFFVSSGANDKLWLRSMRVQTASISVSYIT